MGDSPVVRSIESLPHRFIGDDSLAARFRLHVGRAARDVVVEDGRCDVVKTNGVRPDVEISTSAETWFEIDDGRLSGLEAFAQRRLTVRGSIEKSLLFEPLFERRAAGALSYSLQRIEAGSVGISALIAGDVYAPPLLLIHGLGATKSSWLPIVPELARRHRVIALDLPGFGASTKPRGRYDAPWFTDHVFSLMDVLEIDSASIAGNSMGGRIAQEMAMVQPDRVDAIACLCPANAFVRRPALWLVRLLRPELAFFAGKLPRTRIKESLKDLFADAGRVNEEWFEAAVDDFLEVWRSPRARMAFSAAARNIYLDEPHGEEGFWTRLAELNVPSFYVFGRKDVLITHHFGRKVKRAVPAARVEVWPDCGHVPQIEHPERTATKLVNFFTAASRRRVSA
ncbi:MAG TPA: alpha/beta fold hydrolase [Actinomycetota bacterium]|nr:alpha/beta fold hydrolase [Actinomycetota bacterium]